MRSQHYMIINVERIMHGAGRMIPGDVECLEVVVVILDFRSGCDIETHSVKNIFHPPESARNRMEGAS